MGIRYYAYPLAPEFVDRARADPHAPRPAYALVRGNVTHTDMGWIPWLGVLSPSQVDDVARDLALMDEDEVRRVLCPDGEPLSGSLRQYVMQYLHAAQAFTARMQDRGWGLVYMIG